MPDISRSRAKQISERSRMDDQIDAPILGSITIVRETTPAH